jgi:hypothetical protein
MLEKPTITQAVFLRPPLHQLPLILLLRAIRLPASVAVKLVINVVAAPVLGVLTAYAVKARPGGPATTQRRPKKKVLN